MLNRSLAWLRTWTVVLTFVATLLACPAGSRAERAWYAVPWPGYAGGLLGPDGKAYSRQSPDSSRASCRRSRVRSLLRRIDPTPQVPARGQESRGHRPVCQVTTEPPALSPQAHRLAAEAAQRIGDQNSATAETVFATRCVDEIRATGDGSESRPFLVARVSDEADLLDAEFHTGIHKQGLIFRGDARYDRSSRG